MLFVCLGNICRSPMAVGALRFLAKTKDFEHMIKVDSAGTGNSHIGAAPDSRAQAESAKRSIDISQLRARQVCTGDFYDFDYILAMDTENYRVLEQLRPEDALSRLEFFLDYAPDFGFVDVPDPYFGNEQGFVHVFDMIEETVQRLLDHILKVHNLDTC